MWFESINNIKAAKQLLERISEQEPNIQVLMDKEYPNVASNSNIGIKVLDIIYVKKKDTYFVSYLYRVEAINKAVFYVSNKNGKMTLITLENMLDEFMTYEVSDLKDSFAVPHLDASVFEDLLENKLSEFKSSVMSVSDLYTIPKT